MTKIQNISNNNNNSESFFVDLELNLNSLLEHLLNRTVNNINKNNKVDLSAGSTKTIVSLVDHVDSTHNETTVLSTNVLSGMRVAEFFSVYRFHLLVVFVVLLALIIVILSLMVFNFISRNEADKSTSGATSESSSASANKKLMLKYKKNKNTSFDIIDVGGYYKPARRSSSSFKLFNTNSSNLANFNRSNSTTETQLVVDYDYQFENFNNQQSHLAHQHQQIQQLSSSRTFDKIISLNDHFYEMPAINNYTSLMTAAALATSRRGGNDFDDLIASMNDDGTRFKTFSVRKYEKEKQKFEQSNNHQGGSVMKSNSTRVECNGGKAIITAEDIRIGTNNLKKTNPVSGNLSCSGGGGNGCGDNEISLRLNTNDLRNNMIMEIYEPSISICFDKISLSDLSSVDKQSF